MAENAPVIAKNARVRVVTGSARRSMKGLEVFAEAVFVIGAAFIGAVLECRIADEEPEEFEPFIPVIGRIFDRVFLVQVFHRADYRQSGAPAPSGSRRIGDTDRNLAAVGLGRFPVCGSVGRRMVILRRECKLKLQRLSSVF